MKVMRVFAVICLTAIVAGCGAKTPAEVVKAWAGAHKSVDIEDVMYYSLQDQIKPRIDLAKEAQRTRLEQEWKSESAQDMWGLIKSGDLVREFIRGERAWVILDLGKETRAFELMWHEGKWKVLDEGYASSIPQLIEEWVKEFSK